MKFKSHHFLLILSFTTTIFVAIWVNLLTSKLQSLDWLNAIISLRYNHLWLLFSVCCIVFQIVVHLYLSKKDIKSKRILYDQANAYKDELFKVTLKNSVEGIRALRANIKINARYFACIAQDDKIILKKTLKSILKLFTCRTNMDLTML